MTFLSADVSIHLPFPCRPLPTGKRVLDLTVVAILAPLLLPLVVLIALAIKATSQGPVLFKQTRIGQGGRPFRMLKFRSMYIDAEARRAELLDRSDRDGVCFKSRHDPRVTAVGRLLRRTSLDELPQLVNVLKGDMSLIGPRPALPEEVAAYPPAALERLSVPAGISGLWQVSGRAEIGFEEMVELDIAYARNATVMTDIKLLLRTTTAVVTGRGAY
jgi:lipopolysaccharide/colanic/teichoic acid biosynthesis glycosyltransferase